MKLEKIGVGMTLYATERHQLGNTTMRQTAVIHYLVVEVYDGGIVVERNGRRIIMNRRRAEKLRGTHPKCSLCGRIGTHASECGKARKRTHAKELSSS